jgi:PKD domain-containing protein
LVKKALIPGSLLLVGLGVSFASVLLRHPSSKAAPPVAVSHGAQAAVVARRRPEPMTPVAVVAEKPAVRRPRTVAKKAQPADAATGRRVAARPAAAGDGAEKEPKAPATPESLAAWTYREGDAIAPVLSPELREIQPALTFRDEQMTVDNHRLPYRGEVPGRRPALPDGALQRSFGSSAPTPTGVNFAGIGATGFVPSDDNGRVGPNHFIQTVNSKFAIYAKSGGAPLFGPADINTVFASISGPCKTQNDGDPIVQYDQLADRWLISQFAVDAAPTGLASYQCMAISKTGDPLSAYYLYAFPLSPVLFFDYPHVATWPDGYYATFHVFDETKPASQQFQNQGLVVFERDAMLAGLPARLVNKSVGTPGAQEYFGALAADLDGLTPPPPGSPEYVFIPGSSEWDGSASPRIHVFKAATTWGATPAVVVTGPTNVLTASFNTNLCGFARACVPQPPPAGSSDRFDPITGQFMWRAPYRNQGGVESVLLEHTVNVLVPSANQGATRWYEMRTLATTPTIFQQGTFAPDTDWRVVGSIAMDNGGNVALGYTKSSATVFPGIFLTGRLAGDTAGTLGAEVTMQAGAGSQLASVNRWGDYSAMSVDARDGCSFWYTTQYIPVTGAGTWATRIAAFKFAPANCSAPPQGTLTGTVSDSTGPVSGAIVKLDNGFSGATDSLGVYTIVLPPGSTNAVASAPLRTGCNASASTPVTINDGATTVQNFLLSGTAVLQLAPVVLDDSGGNNNGHVNQSECIVLDLPLDNAGCATGTGISAVLTSSTPGVTVTQGSATYPTANAGARVVNTPRYKVTTSGSLVCGNPINFTLTVSSSAGSTPIPFSLPTCDAPIVQTGALTAGDPTQTLRLFRDGVAPSCGTTKSCPGLSGAGSPHYDTYTYVNTAATSRCVTVDVTPNCSQAGSGVVTAAYLGSYNPASLCANYLADGGTNPSNGGTAEYSFDVPAGATFVVVVNELTANTFCSTYSVQVSGLLDTSPGGAPSAVITAPSSFCVSSTGNTASVADAGLGATYLWTVTGGSITGGQGTRTLTFSAGASGNVVLGVTVTSASGCASTSSSTLPITACGAGSAFFTLPPCRILDTRNATGPYGGPSLVAGASRTIAVAGQCGVPATAKAIAVNFTVTGPTSGGFTTLYPAGTSLPLASTSNFSAGQTRANNAIPLLNGVGDLSIFCGMGVGQTVDVIIDVAGYFQ